MLMDCVMTSTSAQPTLPALLVQRGWVRHFAECAKMRRLGDGLGACANGRGGALEEVLRPQSCEDAHPRSLSAQYGLNALPFHAENRGLFH
jgi:hypothetical protein